MFDLRFGMIRSDAELLGGGNNTTPTWLWRLSLDSRLHHQAQQVVHVARIFDEQTLHRLPRSFLRYSSGAPLPPPRLRHFKKWGNMDL